MNGAIKTSLVIIIVLLIWLFRCGPTCGFEQDCTSFWPDCRHDAEITAEEIIEDSKDRPYQRKPRGYVIPVLMLNPMSSIVFQDESDKVVGAIEWSGGTVVFHGNVDNSAMIFFEYLFDHYMVVGCDEATPTAMKWGGTNPTFGMEVSKDVD